MGKTTVRYKLKKAFSELVAEMKKDSCGLYIVKYNSMEYFLDMDEKEGAFCILQTVMGLQGELSQSEFDIKIYPSKWAEKRNRLRWVFLPLRLLNATHRIHRSYG